MSERKTKSARSRDTWADIELRLLNDVIARDDALKAIILAYERADALAVADAIDTARRLVGGVHG